LIKIFQCNNAEQNCDPKRIFKSNLSPLTTSSSFVDSADADEGSLIGAASGVLLPHITAASTASHFRFPDSPHRTGIRARGHIIHPGMGGGGNGNHSMGKNRKYKNEWCPVKKRVPVISFDGTYSIQYVRMYFTCQCLLKKLGNKTRLRKES
jgi:hypothetical protein